MTDARAAQMRRPGLGSSAVGDGFSVFGATGLAGAAPDAAS